MLYYVAIRSIPIKLAIMWTGSQHRQQVSGMEDDVGKSLLTKNLYEYRKANALTQKDVSEYLNISRQAYSNYETGKRDPDLGLLVKLSELYEISLNQLIVDSFRSSTLMFREVCPPYTVAHREHSDTTLILTEDECDLILKYRQASEEDRRLVRKVLHE